MWIVYWTLQKLNHVFCIFSSLCNRRTCSSLKCDNQHHWWPGRLRCCSHGKWSVSKYIIIHWVNKLSLWANCIPRLLSYPSLQSEREPGNEVGLWTSMDCWPAWQDSKGRGEVEKRERYSLFPFTFFSPPPPCLPLLSMGLPLSIYRYIL